MDAERETVTLPANLDAERSVLGAILLDNNAYLEASDRLTSDDFSLDSHRRIYSRMASLLESNKPVDIVTLIDELAMHKDLQPVGDVGYVSSLISGVPERPSIVSYVEIVVDKAQQRRLFNLCTATIARIEQQSETAIPIMADIEDAVSRIAGKPRQQAKPLREVLQRVLNDMAKERIREREYIGIPTGIEELDQILGGFRESELVIAGAMPGRGKTSFGLQFAINAVREGFSTVDFSLEMKDWQVGRRILAAYTPAEAFGARDAKLLSETKWHQVIEGASQLAALPLFIDETSSLTLRELRARVKLYKKKFGIRLAVVDYLRLLMASGKDTRERVSNIALGLAQLAKDEDICILALSQLSRPEDINHVPDMTDLKESGDLEASAHVVLLLYRPVDKDKGVYTGDDAIIIGKAREGPPSKIDVWYDQRTLQFKPKFMRGIE
jgi:replicative DNA helicase